MVDHKIAVAKPEQALISSSTLISVGVVKPLINSFIGDHIKKDWLNPSWFKYGVFLKSTVNVAYWRVRVSSPFQLDIIPVNSFAEFHNGSSYYLPYKSDVRLDFIPASSFDNIKQNDTLSDLKLTRGGLAPTDKTSIRRVVAPNGIFSVETLDDNKKPIIIGTNYKSDDDQVCEFLLIAKPLKFSISVLLFMFMFIFIVILYFLPPVLKRFYELRDARKYFKK